MEKEARLAELRKSISEMSDQELLTLLDGTRNNRRPPAKKTREATKTAKKKKQSETIVLKQLANLPEAERQAMIAKLEALTNE